MSSFVPPKKCRGSTQKLIALTKENDGISLKKSQAHNILKDKGQNNVSIHIGHYLLLKSYFNFLSQKNQEGTFILETQTCTWDASLEQFKRCYVCFSFVKKFWMNNGCVPLFAVDGSFTTRGIIKHTILFAVSYDGNNELVQLAYCICDNESADNWQWFLSKLVYDYPGSFCCLGDFDKGLQSEVQSLLNSNNILFSRCIRDMQTNCKSNHPIVAGKIRLYETITMKLTKARTEELFDLYLEELGEEIGSNQKEWWSEHRDQYATYYFLSKGVQRYHKVLNDTDQMSTIHKDGRMEPLLPLLTSINEWNMSKFTIRRNKAIQWVNNKQHLTDYALE